MIFIIKEPPGKKNYIILKRYKRRSLNTGRQQGPTWPAGGCSSSTGIRLMDQPMENESCLSRRTIKVNSHVQLNCAYTQTLKAKEV